MHERHLFRSLQIDCAGGSLDSPPKIRLSGDGIPKAARKAKPLMKNLPRDRCRKSPGEDFELCQTFKFPAERISAPGERIGFYWICPNSPAMKSPSGSGRPLNSDTSNRISSSSNCMKPCPIEDNTRWAGFRRYEPLTMKPSLTSNSPMRSSSHTPTAHQVPAWDNARR